MPVESKILERAEMYLRKLSCGVNPLTDEELPETDACRQERISKCLSYVADVIQKDLSARAASVSLSPKKKEKTPRMVRMQAVNKLVLDKSVLDGFEISEVPVSLSGVIRKINLFIPENSGMMPLAYADVAEVLSQEGVLSKQGTGEGKESNLPTPLGESLGFVRSEADIRGRHAVYTKCLPNAQKYVVDNIQKSIELANLRLEKQLEGRKQGAPSHAPRRDDVQGVSTQSARNVRQKFSLSESNLAKYPEDETPVPVTEVARRLNDLIEPGVNMEKIYFKTIRDWFVAQGMLQESRNAVGKIAFVPTEQGLASGILTESRMGKNGEVYDAVLYGSSAQKLVLEHLDEMA